MTKGETDGKERTERNRSDRYSSSDPTNYPHKENQSLGESGTGDEVPLCDLSREGRGQGDIRRVAGDARTLQRWFRVPGSEIDFLSIDYVRLVSYSCLLPHEEYIEKTSVLEGAVNGIAQHYYYAPDNDVFNIAAHVGCRIGKAHAFHTANKRTAGMSMLLFLRRNSGLYQWPSKSIAIYIEKMVEGTMAESAVADLLKAGVGAINEGQ